VGKPGGPTDEIYFVLDDVHGNNNTYVSNTMKLVSEDPNARYHTVHPSETYNFSGEVKVGLWEKDGGGNPPDLLYHATVDAYGNVYDVTDPPGSDYDLNFFVV
jgi:hypothetical protein